MRHVIRSRAIGGNRVVVPTIAVVTSLVVLMSVGADRAPVGGGGGWLRTGPCRLRRCRRRLSVPVILGHAVHYRVRSVVKEPPRSS